LWFPHLVTIGNDVCLCGIACESQRDTRIASIITAAKEHALTFVNGPCLSTV
jgi:hypothetical protein